MKTMEALQGIWRSHGYSRWLVCDSTGFKIYDLTGISCVENMSGSLEDLTEFLDRFQFPDRNHFSAYLKGGITCYHWDRQPGLPESLLNQSTARAGDVEYNFEVFWHYFAENYAFFELRNVDWDAIYKTYRPKVNASTTEAELLDIFGEVLLLLGDDHVSLSAGERHLESAKRHALLKQWQREFESEDMMALHVTGLNRIVAFILSDVLHGEGHLAANRRVVWGKAAPNIGYLMVVAMGSFVGEDGSIDRERGSLSENLAALEKAIDRVMEDFKELDGVIIDARFNPGGADSASLLVANRFADQKRLAFTKKAVTENGYTEEQSIYIYPEGETQFTRPVVYLTSEATISAAEIFTLSMMPLPHVTRMGEPTQGVLSDVLGKKLPNGWELGLSNEVYTACDGELYEGRGIPPHIEIPIYDPDNFYPGLKSTVDKAVEWLEKKLQG